MPAARSRSPSDTLLLRGLLLRRCDQLYERALALAGEHGWTVTTEAAGRWLVRRT